MNDVQLRAEGPPELVFTRLVDRSYEREMTEQPAAATRQCEACAEGRRCERLQALMHAAWRHGETDE